jgi:hypothetical protein
MIYGILIFIILGIAINKEFRNGIGTSIGALIVFTPVILIGVLYLFPYSVYMSVKCKEWRIFFFILWRIVDGTYAAIGDFLKLGFAYRYDELGNVFAEWLEDVVTDGENTTFGDKQTTISASIGFLEATNRTIYKSGKGLSKALNVAFRQKRHAIGSWEKKQALKRLKEQNLHGNY